MEQEQLVSESRIFRLNEQHNSIKNNQVTSTSSTLLTFIPLNLIHQFSNLPNIYFLFIAFLQTIPSISITHGKPTILVPLSFVIIFIMIKDAYEEYLRYQKDKQQNNRSVQVLTSQGYKQDIWQNLSQGQIFKLKQNDLIPCDAIILCTTSPNNKCYLETRSLDGEANLKVRKGPQCKISFHKLPPSLLAQNNFQVQCQKPVRALGKIKANMKVQNQIIPISIENTLLRGCHLRNCKQVICFALYVGSDTKVILNSAKFSSKKSNLMIKIDEIMVKIFIFQLFLSLFLAFLNNLMQHKYSYFTKIIGFSKIQKSSASWWLQMSCFVPISLILTMQSVKILQGKVLSFDQRGYSKQYKSYITANNTQINENLGQIKYVFTDKTGTLTKNQMNFKKIIVGNSQYGQKEDISQDDMKKKFPKTTNVRFADSHFFRNLNEMKIQQALRIIYLCHEIIVNKQTDEQYNYNSSSPDQIALINFAKLCGFQLIEAQQTYIKIYDRQQDKVVKFQKLAFLPFSPLRKRMSVIVRLPNNQIQLLMKGADSMVERRLIPEQPNQKITEQYIQKFSIQGLRTLLLARKVIPQQQFIEWHKQYIKARVSIQDREQRLQYVYEKIENDLILVGGTAVEDKLQDQVSETITMMKNAGMKFFILTGDKRQTAISTGRACGLINPYAKIFNIPQQKEQGEAYQNQKVYLIDASQKIKEYPKDIFSFQTICYRCTPMQKQNVVKYIKQNSKDLTLAIGDGANDVNMILAANVGIGIKGHEGGQAARTADFSIGQFKHLGLLTLYYGREWYRKNCQMVSYSFFKNWYNVLAMVAFGGFTYYSAIVVYDIFNKQLFNVFYSFLPIIIYAIFDQAYTWEESKILSDIYKPGLQNAEFNGKSFFMCIGQSILYGLFSMIILNLMLEDNVLDRQGRTGYMWQSGSVLFFNIIMVINFKIISMSNKLSLGLLITIGVQFILYWVVYWVETKIFKNYKLKDSFYEELQTLPIYMMHFILLFLLSGTEYIYRKILTFHDKKIHSLTKYIKYQAVQQCYMPQKQQLNYKIQKKSLLNNDQEN